MSASHKFQLAFHLKSLRNIGVRQTCFLQTRTVIYLKGLKKENIPAKPYEIINLQEKQVVDENNWAALEDDTFLSPKILVKNNDKNINIDCVCLFKGQIAIPLIPNYDHEIYIYSELIWYMGKEIEVIGQWKGYSKQTNFFGYLDIYFSSHVLTCSIAASVHCIISEIRIQNQQKLVPIGKDRIFFNHSTKKIAQLYDACIDPMVDSLQSIIKWTNEYKKNHIEQLQKNSKIGNQFNEFNGYSWKYNRLAKNLGKNSSEFFNKSLNSLSLPEYFANLKADSYNISTSLYQFWKQFIGLFKKYPESYYMLFLKQNYHRSLEKDHWQNRIILVGEQKQTLNKIVQPQLQKLQFCSVEEHTSKIKISAKDMQLLNRPITRKKDRLIVLVHGFQASSFDMQIIAMYFKFRNPNCHLLVSDCNEGMTQGVIQQCGHRLAVEIKNYINSQQLKDFTISLIGHSLGGVIIRAALRYLQLYKNLFQCYVSICSPHMGYLYHTSTIVTTSMWVMNQVNKNQSMIQLSMSDNKNLSKCYMYELSQRNQLSWFNTVILIASKQDQYVPFSSALLENMEFFYKTESAKIYQAMYNNIVKPIEQRIIRLQIIFNDRVKDLSGFIGRTAHIKVLSFLPIIDLYCHLISKRL